VSGRDAFGVVVRIAGVYLIVVGLMTVPAMFVEYWRSGDESAVVYPGFMILMGVTILRAAEHVVRLTYGRVPTAGRCRHCGYDLRGSPEQCPECGTPTKPVDPPR
jgi:hypothetical protein